MADSTAVGTITSVETKNTSKGEVYEVHTDNGDKYTTWKEPIAKQAKAFEGDVAKLTFYKKGNGDYTNLMLVGVEAANGDAPTPAVTTPVERGEANTPERQTLINRSTALKVAASLAGEFSLENPGEVAAVADRFVAYIETGNIESSVF